MRAVQLTEWQREPELVEVRDPVAGPGQVVVAVGAAGLCHSDLHLMDGALGGSSPWPLPFTLGHEVAGWVHSVGAGVRSVEPGQPVAVYGAWGCGHCERCRVGMENYCEAPHDSGRGADGGLGLGVDGGLADYLLVPHERHLIPLPDGLTPAQAAPLTDAALTPYHAVARSLPKLGPTATAVVIGVGGLGHLTVQIIKAVSGARVIAVDTKRDALDNALADGADVALESGPTTGSEIRTATGERGADVIIDCVGTDSTIATGLGSLRTLGDLTVIGVGMGSTPFGFLNVPYEASLQTIYWGTRPELVEVLDLAARGLLRPRIQTFPMEAAVDAYRALAAGGVLGRAVVVPRTEA
jgi:alcohol dehydrogenase, propanol-preferring